ncbi:hypothetical protein [Streptomyces sp. NPDC006477]|uniref:hypothetical protein n=1 Tax=Streptomyces sp. NPDC006477 TaxID=3364747 RepID=UPI0036CE6251
MLSESLVNKTRRELSGIALRCGVVVGDLDTRGSIIRRIQESGKLFNDDMTIEDAVDALVDLTQGGAFLSEKQAEELVNVIRGIRE